MSIYLSIVSLLAAIFSHLLVLPNVARAEKYTEMQVIGEYHKCKLDINLVAQYVRNGNFACFEGVEANFAIGKKSYRSAAAVKAACASFCENGYRNPNVGNGDQ